MTTTLHPESAFTAPHAHCANPAYWHAPDSDSTEAEVSELVGALVRALQPEIVVETGAAYGYTTLEIGKALRRNGHGCLYSLEVDQGRFGEATLRLLSHQLLHLQDGPVHLLRQSSLDFTPPGPIGFCWFDSLYELRVDEFLRYRSLGCLPPGSVCAFHDWTSGARGHYLDVRAEIDNRLVAPGYLRPVFIPTPRGIVIGEVLR